MLANIGDRSSSGGLESQYNGLMPRIIITFIRGGVINWRHDTSFWIRSVLVFSFLYKKLENSRAMRCSSQGFYRRGIRAWFEILFCQIVEDDGRILP